MWRNEEMTNGSLFSACILYSIIIEMAGGEAIQWLIWPKAKASKPVADAVYSSLKKLKL
jgi:hypothetical protein